MMTDHTIGQNTTAYEEEAEVREGVLHGLSLAYGVPQGYRVTRLPLRI